MLFNSYLFILLFLPITTWGFYQFTRMGGKRLAVLWLVIASLVFYGYWNPPYVILLILSIGVNYILGQILGRHHSTGKETRGKIFLILGLAFNLGLIGYYKYFNFFTDTINSVLGTSILVQQIVLPLGISFYTFQQISYLIDSLEGETKGYRFIDYCLFVSYFPQLIAGPIVTHQEMIPQFSKQSNARFCSENLTIGLTIFFLGLFKKVILADRIALFATPVFSAADAGVTLTFAEAWIGALAYTMQIYFDFSGYSDMAIGAARMMGFNLPINFNSPYKAVNIIDFWQRWHMTLTRFLTRYLYNPLALNLSRLRLQQGKDLIKRGVGSPSAFFQLVAFPTIVTMFLAGLWHGAGWQYIVFGVLHGCYLSVNHGWHMLLKARGYKLKNSLWWERRLGHLLTFGCVIVAMVFFRASTVENATKILAAMVGNNGINLGDGMLFTNQLFETPKTGVLLLSALMFIAFCFPNTQEWLANFEPVLGGQPSNNNHTPSWLGRLWQQLRWKPTAPWAAVTAALAVAAFLGLAEVSEFIYFQF